MPKDCKICNDDCAYFVSHCKICGAGKPCCSEPVIAPVEHDCEPGCLADAHWCVECVNCGAYCGCEV